MRKWRGAEKERKRTVTIRLDEQTLFYFHELAYESGIPYQTLINHYLGHCARAHLLLDLSRCPRQRELDD